MIELFVILWQLLIFAGAVAMLMIVVTSPLHLMAVILKLGALVAWMLAHYFAFYEFFVRNYTESGGGLLDPVSLAIVIAVPLLNILAILGARRALAAHKAIRKGTVACSK